MKPMLVAVVHDHEHRKLDSSVSPIPDHLRFVQFRRALAAVSDRFRDGDSRSRGHGHLGSLRPEFLVGHLDFVGTRIQTLDLLMSLVRT